MASCEDNVNKKSVKIPNSDKSICKQKPRSSKGHRYNLSVKFGDTRALVVDTGTSDSELCEYLSEKELSRDENNSNLSILSAKQLLLADEIDVKESRTDIDFETLNESEKIVITQSEQKHQETETFVGKTVFSRHKCQSSQYWKCARIEFVASFLFGFASSYSLILAKLLNTCPPNNSHDEKLLLESEREAGKRTSSPRTHEESLEYHFKHSILVSNNASLFNLNVALVHGFAQLALVSSLTQSLGQVSGCHLTPSISLALLLRRKMSCPLFGIYILAQMLGSLLAAHLLLLVTNTQFVDIQIDDAKLESLSNQRRAVESNESHNSSSTSDQVHISSRTKHYSLLPLALPPPQLTIFQATNNSLHHNFHHQQQQLLAYMIALPNASQSFWLQLISITIIVLTYSANADKRRIDTGFKSLSIGISYLLASILTASSGNFIGSPQLLISLAALTWLAENSTWQQEWVSILLKKW